MAERNGPGANCISSASRHASRSYQSRPVTASNGLLTSLQSSPSLPAERCSVLNGKEQTGERQVIGFCGQWAIHVGVFDDVAESPGKLTRADATDADRRLRLRQHTWCGLTDHHSNFLRHYHSPPQTASGFHAIALFRAGARWRAESSSLPATLKIISGLTAEGISPDLMKADR